MGTMASTAEEHAEHETGNMGCAYDVAGHLCGAKPRARGYCMPHYRALKRRGAFELTARKGTAPGLTEAAIDRNLGHLDRARLLLQENTAVLVQNLLDAAAVAAKRGDSKPAEWALLHSRTLEPVLTGGAASAKGSNDHQGVRVIVGVQLSTSTVPSTNDQVIQSSVTAAQSTAPTLETAGRPDQLPPALPAHQAPAGAVLEAQLITE